MFLSFWIVVPYKFCAFFTILLMSVHIIFSQVHRSYSAYANSPIIVLSFAETIVELQPVWQLYSCVLLLKMIAISKRVFNWEKSNVRH